MRIEVLFLAGLSLLGFHFVGLPLPMSAAAQSLSGEGTPIVPTATDEDYARVVRQSVEDYIVPAYARLQDAAERLDKALASFCAAPGEPQGAAVREAFLAAVEAWAGVDFLRFGPMEREGRNDRFAFFPDRHGTGGRQLRRFLLTKDEKLLQPGALAGQTVAVQGLPALESLLFAGSNALLGPEPPEDYRCALALAIGENMRTIAGEAVAGWSGEESWATLLENPGVENPVYLTHAEAMTEMLKALLTGLEQMRDQRLLAALGDTPAAAKANRAPYNAAGGALTYLAASEDALHRFVEASGILQLVPEDQSAYARSAEFEFSNLHRALTEAGDDLEAALADPQRRSKLSYAAIVLASLRNIFERQIAVWIGLTPGFNSLDGD